MKSIFWDWDGDEKRWYRFTGDKSILNDDPDYLVFEVEPNHWAGWLYLEDRSRTCITWDYLDDDGAKNECELYEEGMGAERWNR